jgi:hypothetical protein
MRKLKDPRALVTAVIVFLFVLISAAPAQDRFLSGLEGTSWATQPIVLDWTDGITLLYLYRFASHGRVGRVIIVNRPPGVKFNPFSNGLNLTTGVDGIFSEAGTYRQTGKSLHLEFPNEIQEGELQLDKIVGQAKWMSGNGRNLRFVASKVSTDTDEWHELTISSLVGTWDGSFDQVSSRLSITRVEGDSFYGELSSGGARIAIEGSVDPATRRISFKETEILSLGNVRGWTPGVNRGFVENKVTVIKGAGDAGGHIYAWQFSKK